MSYLCAKCGKSCEEAEHNVHILNDCHALKCPQCTEFFNSERALLQHIRGIHNKEFQCTICQKTFLSKYDLKIHLEWTHKVINGDKKSQTCETCGQVFTGKTSLKTHINRAHRNDFECRVCGAKYTSVYSIRKHMRLKHSDVPIGIDGEKIKKYEKIECPKCGKLIAKRVLQYHIRKNCGKSSLFPCYVCNKECFSEIGLQKHINRRHEEEVNVEALLKKKFKCPMCPQKFSQQSSLTAHMYKHEGKFKCEKCDKSYSAKLPLKKHRLKVHGLDTETKSDQVKSENTIEGDEEVALRKKYKCQICSRRFMESYALKIHIKGKHEGQYKCEVCNKLLGTPYKLMAHRSNVHGLYTEIKSDKIENETSQADPDSNKGNKSNLKSKERHACQLCSKIYTSPYTLKTHIKAKHEGQFKCEVCGFLFSAPYPLMRHRLCIHGLETENESGQTKSKSREEKPSDDEENGEKDMLTTSLEVKIKEENKESC